YPAIINIANIDDDPTVLFDISGQARPATATAKDVGCDEYTTGSTTNRPLTLSDVGPSYLGGPGALPVELISFSAEKAGNGVRLRWSTATEVNNYGFDIERKINGNNWIRIAIVAGSGSSAAPRTYDFLDNTVYAGGYCYRLKQIDQSGAFEYSSETVVDDLHVPEFDLSNNYPNPFNPETMIRFRVKVNSNVELTVYSVTGEHIKTLYTGHAETGRSYEVRFTAAGMASGVYFCRLQSAGRSISKQMLLIR
ncbi:MAG: T9SS type A sorting domain-containing protein, partial [Bacteroidota bacterium]